MPGRSTDRQISLDGLRGIAVAMVFFYHHNWLQIGWTGVDLFFVISGYLITTILRRTRGDAHFWKEFWVKRATRILPPLLLLLLAVAVTDRERIVWLPALLLSLGDLAAYMRPHFESTRPLWSLAVEEHFYLLWPFAVRNLQRRTLLAILVTIIVGEPLLRGFAVSHVPDWQLVYFLTPFRLDGISLGSLLALLAEVPMVMDLLGRWSLVFFALSLGSFGALRLLLGEAFTRGNAPFYNAAVYTIVALAAFFLVVYLIQFPRSILARALSLRPLVFLGAISYGLYLYQDFVLVAVIRFGHISWRSLPLCTGPITLLAAWASFTFYEKPLILWGKRKAQSFRPLHAAAVSPPTCHEPVRSD